MIAPVRSVYGFGAWLPATSNTMLSPATSTNCASSKDASIGCGMPYSFVAAKRARKKWEQFAPVFDRWIPPPRVLHPYPDTRFYATHPS